jgi:hypothetical protein
MLLACTSAKKTFKICFWIVTEGSDGSGIKVMHIWCINGKRCIIGSWRNFFSSGFLYLYKKHQWQHQAKKKNCVVSGYPMPPSFLACAQNFYWHMKKNVAMEGDTNVAFLCFFSACNRKQQYFFLASPCYSVWVFDYAISHAILNYIQRWKLDLYTSIR